VLVRVRPLATLALAGALTCSWLALAACTGDDLTPGERTGYGAGPGEPSDPLGEGGTSGEGGRAVSVDGGAGLADATRDANASPDAALRPLPTLPPVPGSGHVVFHDPNGKHYRVEAVSGAAPQDLAAGLDALSPGSDARVTLSTDGQWLGLVTSRFGCGSNRCVAIAAYDFSYGEPVIEPTGRKITNVEGRAVVSAGGKLVVYTARGGPHARDLYAVTRHPTAWGSPVLLSGASPHAYASDPQISPDGKKAVFDCGPDPYSQTGTAVCEVGVDGTGFRVISSPSDLPNGRANHHPSVAPDGTVVFEGDWSGERVWRSSGGSLAPVAQSYSNDNTPCVLPDGRIASLWLQRPGGPSYHELKLMNGDGTGSFMLVIGVDIIDDGLTCGK
jgi:hypothetical protein